jgi:signal transduction histidine kinase
LNKDLIVDLLAGRRSLDWRALLFTWVLYLLFTVDLYVGHVQTDAGTTLVLIPIGLSLGIAIPYFLRPVIAPTSQRNSLWRLGLLYFSSGMFTAVYFIFTLGIPFSPPGQGVSAWVLLATNGLVTLLWNGLAHCVLSLLSNELNLIRQLGAKAEALIQVRRNAQQQLANELQSLRDAISVQITNVLLRITAQVEGLNSSTSPVALAERAVVVRKICDREVRALSHEISNEEFSPRIEMSATPKLSVLLAHVPLTQSSIGLHWHVVAGVGTLNALVISMQTGGWLAAVAAISSIVIGLGFLVALDRLRRNWLPTIRPALALALVALEYLLVTETALLVLGWVAKVNNELERFIGSAYLIVPVVVIVLWLSAQSISTLSVGLRLHRDQLARENSDLTDAVALIQLKSRGARIKLGKLLHGTIQGRLASVSLALTAASGAQKTEQVEQLIMQARDQLSEAAGELEEALVQSSTPSSLLIRDELAALSEGWRNLVEIGFDLQPEAVEALDSQRAPIELVTEAIQECLTNAVRHGQANQVEIRISLSTDLVLEVLNNGSAPVGVVPGFGISNIAEFASTFEVSEVAGRTLVRVSWPLDS